ncbi:hypothetical protein ElyMa_003734200 [Elysia marginata]|uniref:Uncharacterized protein n=1 Tax=Elysia marginata TaxID=1093978 RepID=A0AAV4F6X5_9GAST|nr:hypothetical protein ElyMa_003734200 [Elysia marginata]
MSRSSDLPHSLKDDNEISSSGAQILQGSSQSSFGSVIGNSRSSSSRTLSCSGSVQTDSFASSGALYSNGSSSSHSHLQCSQINFKRHTDNLSSLSSYSTLSNLHHESTSLTDGSKSSNNSRSYQVTSPAEGSNRAFNFDGTTQSSQSSSQHSRRSMFGNYFLWDSRSGLPDEDVVAKFFSRRSDTDETRAANSEHFPANRLMPTPPSADMDDNAVDFNISVSIEPQVQNPREENPMSPDLFESNSVPNEEPDPVLPNDEANGESTTSSVPRELHLHFDNTEDGEESDSTTMARIFAGDFSNN